jgi:hypothetical protein
MSRSCSSLLSLSSCFVFRKYSVLNEEVASLISKKITSPQNYLSSLLTIVLSNLDLTIFLRLIEQIPEFRVFTISVVSRSASRVASINTWQISTSSLLDQHLWRFSTSYTRSSMARAAHATESTVKRLRLS